MSDGEIEVLHLRQFLEILDISVSLERCKPPEPDFMISLNGKVVGIEHTRLLLDNETNNLIKHHVSADRILENAEAMFKAKRKEKVTVYVDFKCTYGLNMSHKMLTAKDVKKLSNFIFRFVDLYCPPYGEYVSFEQFDMSAGLQVLPDFINRISIHNKYNCWTAAQGGIVPDIRGKELKHCVKSKDKKPHNYLGAYDEIWLLIVENQWALTTYFDFSYADIIEVDSSYNKVFILRSGNNEVKECVNLKPERLRWKGDKFYS